MIPIPIHIDAFPLRYFGHKGRLLDNILPLIPDGTRTLVEPFGGTGCVSYSAKLSGIRVIVNDVLLAAHLRHRAFIANNGVFLTEDDLRLLTGIKKRIGIFHDRYLGTLGNANAAFLDGMASRIPDLSEPLKRDIATVIPCLVAAQNLKFNSYRFTAYGGLTGYQHLQSVDMKQEFLDFVHKRLPLIVHDNGLVNEAHQMDAIDLLGQVEADCAYIDSPYAGAKSAVYEPMYCIFDDWSRYLQGRRKEVRNSYDAKADLPPYTRFDRRRSSILGFFSLFEAAQHIPTIILSYNTTSGISPDEIVHIAHSFRRKVTVKSIPYRLPVTTKGKNDYTEEVLITATAVPRPFIAFSKGAIAAESTTINCDTLAA